MRVLLDEAKKVMEMLDVIDVPYGEVIEWKVNTRAKARWGQACVLKTVRGKNKYGININIDLLDERNPVEALQSTIAHELLHTCPKCMNHGELWKRHARLVNDCYPFLNIHTVSSAEEKKVVYQRPEVGPKYEIVCDGCGKKFYYRKHTYWMDTMTGCTCPTCKSHKFTLKTLR